MPPRLRQHAATAGTALAVTVLALAGCSSSAPASGPPAGGGTASGSAVLAGTINASGSTFQLTFQEVAISGFRSVQPGITVSYDGTGSGAGRAALAASPARRAEAAPVGTGHRGHLRRPDQELG